MARAKKQMRATKWIPHFLANLFALNPLNFLQCKDWRKLILPGRAKDFLAWMNTWRVKHKMRVKSRPTSFAPGVLGGEHLLLQQGSAAPALGKPAFRL